MNIYIPDIDIPKIDIARIDIPNIDIPKIDIPNIDIPKIDIPKIDIPNIDIPKIDIPKIDIPNIDIPKIDIPRIDIPKIDIPKIDIPNFSIDNSIILEITNIIDENDGLFHQLTLGGESVVMLGDSSINNDNNNSNSNIEALTLNDETVENTVLFSGGVSRENSLQSSSNHKTSSLANPSDPLFSLQWHLLNPSTTGIWGINALDVWQDYTGKGVSVSVIDSGVDPNHSDLRNNFDYINQFDAQIGQQGTVTLDNGEAINSGAPKIGNLGDFHGSGVAGLIAAERNDVGVVGVAYDSTIVPIYAATETPLFPFAIANSFAHAAKFEVSNNSWSIGNTFENDPNTAFIDNFQNELFEDMAEELEQAVSNGRDGLGTIFVQSAGNTRQYGDDVNLHNFQNSRYNITVAATSMRGKILDYSTPGAAVTVSAPSSDAASPNLITTDLVGADGYSPLGDYALFNGTSGSAPIVSGVTALMLEANPDLGWRDVQEILFYSALNSDRTSQSWETNGANNWNGGGLTVSHDFGSGLVDAHGAVRLAETWQTQSTSANEDVVSVSSTDSSPIVIPDNDSTGISSSVMVDSGLDIDYVELELDIDHNFIGDLEVTLTSSDGTVSTLVNRPGVGERSSDVGSNQDDIKFVFGSTQHWGETGEGEWTVTVKDLKTGDLGQLNNYTLSLYGDDINGNDTYIYTNEFALFGSIPTRQILTDDTGVDTINTAAVTTDSLINLNPNSLSRIAGINTQIAADTTIENAFTGDGNDTLTGNSSDNILMGGRGEDILTGGGGADTFVFNSLTEGIDVITDFDRSDNDIIQIDSGRFGSLSLEQFSFDSTTGSLSFEGQEFVTIENSDNNNGFIVAQDVVIV